MEPTLPCVAATSIADAEGADILHILDSCCTDEVASSYAEVLAATSGADVAEPEAQVSFLQTINEQLRALDDQQFITVVDLYAKITEERRALQIASSPLYIPWSCIRLQKRSTISKASHIGISPNSPRVLMTAHIAEEPEEERLNGFKNWLDTHVAHHVQKSDVTLVGAWDTDPSTTTLLLEMPRQIWSLLPSRRAYNMVEMVHSANKLVPSAATVTLASRPFPGSENQKPG